MPERPRRPWKFFGVYFLLYMSNAIYTAMVPVHLNDNGMDSASIGLILSAGPLVMLITQPLWGAWGDRAASRKRVLLIMLLGAALAALAFLLPVHLPWMLMAVILFVFFQSAAFPMSDAMALDNLARQGGYPYGRVRMAGTLGFILMSLLAGQVARLSVHYVFYLMSGCLLLTALTATTLPDAQGQPQHRGKLAVRELLQDKTLCALLLFFMIYQITLAYHSSFFAIQVRAVGGEHGVSMVGVAFMLSALVEIPVLLALDRVWKKIGTGWLMLLILAVNTLRWLLVWQIQDLYPLVATQALHAIGHALSTSVMARYVAQNAPERLRVSGQMLVFMAGMGLARGIGSLLSGQLAGAVGIANGFFWCGMLLLVTLIPLAAWLLRRRAKGVAV